MNRWMYWAQVRPGKLHFLRESIRAVQERWQDSLTKQGAVTCSVFLHEHTLFVYVEASFGSEQWSWPEEVQQWLERLPNPAYKLSRYHTNTGDASYSYHILMPNVFYDGTVSEIQSGRQLRETTERVGLIAFLRPEMVSSYVFYHYQMQEEKPGGFNQSYSIGLNGELLFSYYELPAMKGPSRVGKLTTNQTPSNWHDIMAEHFTSGKSVDDPVWTRLELYFSF